MPDDSSERRLKILDPDEIQALYERPSFTQDDRELYFTLTPPEKAALRQLHTKKSQLYCILQMGYFKASHRFFIFRTGQVEEDAEYVRALYFPDVEFEDFIVNKDTRFKHHALILELYGYQMCDAEARRQLALKAQQAARLYSHPVYIFQELMQYMTEHRLVAPGYTFFQDIIGQALSYEQDRLIGLAQAYVDADTAAVLQALLSDSTGLYEITRLKREPKDFGEGEIAREIERGKQIRPLYLAARRLLPMLEISNESVKYYASLVNYYSVFRFTQLDPDLVNVYLLCYVHYRYQKLHDNLINCFIYHVRQYLEETKVLAKEEVYSSRIEHNSHLKKAGHVLKLFTDDEIEQETRFGEVQTKAFQILERGHLARVAQSLIGRLTFDEVAFQWQHIDGLSRRFKRRLRPILLAIELEGASAVSSLMEAIAFLKAAFQEGTSLRQVDPDEFPLEFVPEQTLRYLYGPGGDGKRRLLADRYEFMVYRRLREAIEAGNLYCRDSIRFRSFEDDLIPEEQWATQKEELIAKTGLSKLMVSAEERLASLREQLERRLAEVNERIASGENTSVRIKKKRGGQVCWTLPYSRGDETVNHPFFDQVEQIDIHALLHFVNQKCHFLDACEHILPRYGKQTASEHVILACMVAWGTNMGLGRMGKISDIDYQTLATASDNFIRPDILKEFNDRVTDAIAGLPIFHYYDLGGSVHSSSDGQKVETLIHTLNARHSPKYFGLKKGVVSYTLVANHAPVNADIIGANEHESHYVFDIIYNNTSDIQPTVHSTDTHGVNQVNFAILDFFNKQFAPRYVDVYSKVRESLYGFQHPSQYDPDWLLKPIRKIKDDLVIEEWDNIQRIIVSLALKTTTQSIIVGKLSSYARRNKTRRAFWEYDNIIASLYLLDYIDSPPMRRNVQRALNRGENYHQLRKAVSYANFGKLRFKTEYEQRLWNESSRLIANCIIYYNMSILSALLALNEESELDDPAAPLRGISPVAWQHINFYGRYEFTKIPALVDIQAIVCQLRRQEISLDPTQEV